MNIKELFNDNKVKEDLQSKLKELNFTEDLSLKVYDILERSNYSVRREDESIIVKIDKRKNRDIMKEDIHKLISSILDTPKHLSLIFTIQDNKFTDEIIIRTRRERTA